MEQVSTTLQRIMAQTIKRLPPEQLPQAAWDFAAGRAVAEKTRVIACEQKTLLVEVPDPNWRAQLYSMAPQFLARLNQFIPVERIEFKLPAPAAGAASVAAYPPAPAAGAASVAAYPPAPAAGAASVAAYPPAPAAGAASVAAYPAAKLRRET